MASPNIVVIAGGPGKRFWPVSRKKRPKQFLSISPSGESLIQATAARMAPLTEEGELWVVTNVEHEKLVEEHVPNAKLMVEPVARSTAAAIGLAAISIKQDDPDGVMVVLPADHAVKNDTKLVSTIREGISLAQSQEVLVTIGIQPTSPNTAYGYIHRGVYLQGNAYNVSRLYEKPSLSRAVDYCDAGEYYWNSGMFVWRVPTILKAFEEYMPELYAGLLEIEGALGTEKEAEVIARVYDELESTSIDFGVLEHSRNCAVIVAEPLGWTDIGSWDSWAEHFDKDDRENLAQGDTMLVDSSGSVVFSEDRFVALLGVEDLVVIDSGNAVLVCNKERVQDVKKIVAELKKLGRSELV